MPRRRFRKTLLEACSTGDYQYLCRFIEKNPQKAKFQVIDNHNWGPLHHAVISNSLPCVQLLLSTKLLNIRCKSHEGHTCLFVAIGRSVSSDIIRALIQTDPKLFNIPNNEKEYPLHRAVAQKSLTMAKVMIETLKEMGQPIPDQFDLDEENSLFLAVRTKNIEMIDYLMDNIRFDYGKTNDNGLNAVTLAALPIDNADDESNIVKIFQKLLPLTYDLNSAGVFQQMMLPAMFSCLFAQSFAFKWLMKEFYLADTNKEKNLVKKSLEALSDFNFEYKKIVIGLHSGIWRFEVTENDLQKNSILYGDIIKDFFNIFMFDRELFTEIVTVLAPKLRRDHLTYAVQHFTPICSIEYTPKVAQVIEMFDLIKIGDIVYIDILLNFRISPNYLHKYFLLLMPFSDEHTADIYLRAWGKDKLRTLQESGELDELAKFCIAGAFRKQNTLMDLCRAEIRSAVFGACLKNMKSSEKLQRLMSLNVPNKIKNYLLFNYTDYKFK